MYDRFELNVTRPEPIGYLCLSVSMPADDKQIYTNHKIVVSNHSLYMFTSTKTILSDKYQKMLSTCIDDTVKQIVHDFGQAIGRQFTVQCTDEHSFGWIQFLRCRNHVVGVGNYPWNDFHLQIRTKRIQTIYSEKENNDCSEKNLLCHKSVHFFQTSSSSQPLLYCIG